FAALATASWDGKVRLYDRDFKLVVSPRKATGGDQPHNLAFSPDGTTLALGYGSAATVDLFDGHSLASLPRPNVDSLRNGYLSNVTWSKDGKILYAGGPTVMMLSALLWHGPMRAAASGALCRPAAIQSRACWLCRTAGSWLLRKTHSWSYWNRVRRAHHSPKADLRDQYAKLAVSSDGAIIDFGFEQWGKSPLRFDLRALKLTRDPPADQQTILAKRAGLAVEGWRHGLSPTLDGKPIA